MKKVVGCLATLMAMLMLFASCGKSGSNAPATTAESTAATSTAPASTEPEEQSEPPVDLTMAVMAFGAVPADLQLVEDELNKIVTPKINAKIKLMVINFGAAMQQYNLMLSSNEKLDLMVTFPRTYPQLVAKGQIQEIGPLLDQYGQGIKEALGEQYLKGSMISGKIYGVRPISDMAAGNGLLIVKEIVDKYNLDLTQIKKYEDIELILKAIKDKEPNSTPLVPSNVNSSMLEIYNTCDILTDRLGVLLNYGQELKVVNWYETEEYAGLLKTMRNWYLKGYILKNAATNKEDQFSLIKAKKGYAYVVPTKPGLDVQESNSAGVEVVVADITGPFSSTSNVTLFQWVVPTSCKTPDKAVQMLNLMYTDPDVENLLAWGIEGKHYVKKDNGLIGYPEGVNAQNSGYNLQTPWMMGNCFITHVWEGNSPDVWKKTDEWNKSAKISKAMGFSYDATPVKTEVAALTNVVAQYKMALDSGTVDPEKVLPEFIAKLKANGIDKVIAEKQRQLDAWAKENNIK